MSTTSVQGVYAVNSVLPVLGIIAVALRFYVRSTQKVKLTADDWLQIPAVVLFIGMAAAGIYGARHKAFGYPTPLRPPTDPAPSLILCEKLWYIIQIFQIVDLAIIKVAALLFYRRIFVSRVQINGVLHKTIWFLIILTTIWGMGFVGYAVGACGSHVSAAWSGYIGFEEFCLTSERFEQAYAISDFILDTVVLIVPLPSIWSLQMNFVRKLSVSAVFMLALIGYGASIARLVIFVKRAGHNLSAAAALPDIQSTDTQAVWFSSLETGLAIFALNLPAIWPLISKISVESIVNSLRSVLSLNSVNSQNRSQRSYNEIRRQKTIKDPHPLTTDTDNIKLVSVKPGFEFKTTTKGDWHSQGKGSSHTNLDIEKGGIRVKKSVDINSERN